MVLFIVVLLILLWVGGLLINVGGIVWLLLVIALVLYIYDHIKGHHL